MRALAFGAFLAGALLFLVAPAHAQRAPTAAQVRAGEALVRAHYPGRTILGVRALPSRSPYRSWGLAYWVRFQDDGGFSGRYAFVRGQNVLDADGDAGVRALLQADQFLTSRAWAAADLAVLLRELHATTPLQRTPVLDPHAGILAPRIVRENGTVTLVLYAHTGFGPPEAPSRPHYYVTRATLHFAADCTMTWTTEDVVLDVPRNEQ